jgi:hypothetical protein
MSLLKALTESSICSRDPFLHWQIDRPFTPAVLKEINSTFIPDVRRDYDGTRAGDAVTAEGTVKTRCYVTTENVHEFPAIGGLVDELLSMETVERLEDMLERKMRGNYLRVEVICDRHGFWLAPHKDIKEKLMSMLLYSNPCGESENLGTDLYDGDLKLVKTMPYRNNYGYMFAPAHDTWHGLEKKEIAKERRSMLINYVTFPTCWQMPHGRAAVRRAA